jgi:GNAT superfamily N-acetyltransferase
MNDSMDIDALPDLARARLIKSRATGLAIRDDGRAAAVVFVSDGSIVPRDWIVRFDVAAGEDPVRRLADGLAASGARGIWFYGGDATTRRAVVGLGLSLTAQGGVAIHRHDPRVEVGEVRLRPPSALDRVGTDAILSAHPDLRSATVLVATYRGEVVGHALIEPLDAQWSEVRAYVNPAMRGRGLGKRIFAKIADQLESAGRFVCAAFSMQETRARDALEAAGFRLADYYFTAFRSVRDH